VSDASTPSAKGVCLITGGSRGIGAATARLASARGYSVAITYLSRSDAAHAVVADIEAAGGHALAIQADVACEADVVRAFAAADALGPLTVLVNNAGIVGDVGRLEDVTGAMLDTLVRTNIVGAFLAAREAVRRMSTRRGGKGGCIVNVSSGAAQLGSPNVWIHYAATKGALDTMTIGLAKEVGGEGIRVNAVRPGIIDTEIHAGRPPGQLEKMRQHVPLGRIGTPDEIAAAILWLASDEASYVTAALLDARGGI
jgi:NAD(P)-dependent dehydrogenase (short-subunit alcohol dehydrogenase family)